ncbi:MAG: zinc ribbon domain-containing protein [Candidatus Marinimicrobia bacterium]|nr:zinc ribbon domain-containing protein [Candidatus Neomarinimicrobiota bacterium]
MPFYDYKCSECSHTFSQKQSITDDSFPNCPQCGSPTKRLIQGTGLVFKGNGFYATDYQKSSTSCEGGCENPKRCCQN